MLVSLKLKKENIKLPQHVAIIMDGNGRWAQKRGLPRTAGHTAGARVFQNVVNDCRELGIKYLTVYAFSTENWKRPPDETKFILGLLSEYIGMAFERKDENICVRFIGDISALPEELSSKMLQLEQGSEKNKEFTLCVAINYGGRADLVNAAAHIASLAKHGALKPSEITEETVSNALYTRDIPDPDLIIRTGGELRISNFLLWQAAYAELYFSKVLWPEFNKKHLMEALEDYTERQRRFGDVKSSR